MLGQVRQFNRFCITRKWLTENWASREYLKINTRVEPEDPFSDDDAQAILDACNLVGDSHGKLGQQNAKELLVFCYVLRYSGLRISDAVMLTESCLVPRPGDARNFALAVYQKETKKLVYIPIPSGDIPNCPDVAAALRSLPIKQGRYFFNGSGPNVRRNTNAWHARMVKLFDLVSTPHVFRHTFAARLLEREMDIRDVAEFLGDTIEVRTKHYSKYTKYQQRLAVERWKKAMGA
jgi:integrase